MVGAGVGADEEVHSFVDLKYGTLCFVRFYCDLHFNKCFQVTDHLML